MAELSFIMTVFETSATLGDIFIYKFI